MLFIAAHTCKVYTKEYPTHVHPGKEGKLKKNILHTVGVKIRTTENFSNNAVPDLNENNGGSTDLANKWYGLAVLHTTIDAPPYL